MVRLIIGNLIWVAFLVFAVRVFRGADENIAAPRPWWKMTARPTAGFVLGALSAASVATYMVRILSRRTTGNLDFWDALSNSILFAGIAVAYTYSSIRSRRLRNVSA